MSGFFDKIKDAGKDALSTFVELEEDEAAEGAPRPAAAPSGAPVAAASSGAAPDPEFIQQLQAAVQGSKKAAYAQFRTLFGALSAVPDEAQRTQLALAACQASHSIDAAAVADAMDDRLRILADEKAAFEKAVKLEADHSVGGAEAEIQKARAEIARKQEEIRALEVKAAELESTLRDARSGLDASSARFAASYAVVEAELAAERARITPFLPGQQP
jgi:chromosome segregation ATPase